MHDHHFPRHGHVDHKDKKGGAGRGNWGTLEDTVMEAEHKETIDTFSSESKQE